MGIDQRAPARTTVVAPPEEDQSPFERPIPGRPPPTRRAAGGTVRAGVLVGTAAGLIGLGAWASGSFQPTTVAPVATQQVGRPLEMFRYAPSPWQTPQPVEMFPHTPREPAVAPAPDAPSLMDILRAAIARLWGAPAPTTARPTG
jgi:hypothetical protein